eukprot:GHVS01039668.1.p1 GENE.GHVS01039668.1~~GHVS01039668.1.p1  ORF type:complete len:194 (+),score=48.31 GHVS01039668.1:193-774(+)
MHLKSGVVSGLAVVCLFAAVAVNAQLHFASLGNWGFPDSSQAEVAATLKSVAASDALEFIISPGSNFAGGVSGVNDTKWKDNYETIYGSAEGGGASPLHVPFFTVLGVEDWAGSYSSELAKTQMMYNDTDSSDGTFPKWTIPNWWYHYLTHFSTHEGSSTTHEVVTQQQLLLWRCRLLLLLLQQPTTWQQRRR